MSWRKEERERLLTFKPPPNQTGAFAKLDKKADIFKDKYGIIAGHFPLDEKSLFWNGQKAFFYNPQPGQWKTVLNFGGMGSYKTSSLHIPLALQFGIGRNHPPGAMIILETTGETSAVARPWRARHQPTCRIDPTDLLGRYLRNIIRKRFNVIDGRTNQGKADGREPAARLD